MLRSFSLLSVAVFTASCLYLGGVNHAPEGELGLITPLDAVARGQWVQLAVKSRDPDGERLERAWTVSLQQEGGAARCALQNVDGLCTDDAAVVLSREDTLRFFLPLDFAGSYRAEVRCTLTDPQGASYVAEHSLLVTNGVPEVRVIVTNGDEPSAGFARHETLRLSVAGSGDEAGDLTCGSGATVSWARLGPAEDLIELWKVIPCRGEEILDKLLVRLAPGQSREGLRIRATVKDKWGAEQSTELDVSVAATQPPCVTAMRPAAAAGTDAIGAVVMDGTPLMLSVVDTAPLSSQQLGFRWSSASALDGSYVDLARQPGAHLSLDTVAMAPGERRFYRVRVEGGVGVAAPRCGRGEALCAEAELPKGCYRWVTWEVVGR